jgi:hypothetical protein
MAEPDIDNEYLELPDDAEEAFAELQRRKYRALEQHWENQESGGGWFYERRYVDHLTAFDEVHNLGLLTEYRSPPANDTKFGDFFQDFRRHAEITTQKILMEAARRQKTSVQQVVVLDAPARSAIHKLIEAIREKLNEWKLPEAKREAMFNKLNAFASEVDRNRTRTEAFFAFAIDAARTARGINDEIKPLQETIDRIFGWLDKATQWKDALPPWSDRRKIEGPPKRLPAPGKNLSEKMDDEIPF